jgi:hypothetical protein
MALALAVWEVYFFWGGDWPTLSNGIKDAEEVAKGLAAQGFEVTFNDDTLRDFFIVDGDDPNARLLLWFAGHGDTIDGEAYLVPTDAPLKVDAQFRVKAISLRRFGEYMREAKARQRVGHLRFLLFRRGF